MNLLDRCPFCGSGGTADFWQSDYITMVFIRCVRCQARGPEIDATHIADVQVANMHAAHAWNRRTANRDESGGGG